MRAPADLARGAGVAAMVDHKAGSRPDVKRHDLPQGSVAAKAAYWPMSSADSRKEGNMTDEKRKTVFEVIEVAGSQVIEQVRAILREGNARSLKITTEDRDLALEMPLTVGAIAGGAVALTAPWLAVLGVIAALVTKVRIEVERDEPPAPPSV